MKKVDKSTEKNKNEGILKPIELFFLFSIIMPIFSTIRTFLLKTIKEYVNLNPKYGEVTSCSFNIKEASVFEII